MYTYTMNGRYTITLAISDAYSDESYPMSQVPIADDGVAQVDNLFGFDSLSRRHKSVGPIPSALLADGLGVRPVVDGLLVTHSHSQAVCHCAKSYIKC